MLTSTAMMKLTSWLSDGGSTAGRFIISPSVYSWKKKYIMTPIMTSRIGATIALEILMDEDPFATMSATITMAPTVTIGIHQVVMSGCRSLTTLTAESIARPNMVPRTTSQPTVNSTRPRMYTTRLPLGPNIDRRKVYC